MSIHLEPSSLAINAIKKLREIVETRQRLRRAMFMKLVFKPLAPIHIAGGRREMFIPIYRVGGEPYIPPTSIYGALRSIAEMLVKGMQLYTQLDDVEKIVLEAHCELETEGLRHICSVYGKEYVEFVKRLINELRNELQRGIPRDKALYTHFFTDEGLNEVGETLQNVSIPSDLGSEIEHILATLCPVCRLFGGPGIRSNIVIISIEPEIAGTYRITNVSIDRNTGVAREGNLFAIEGLILSKLHMDIYVRNVDRCSPEAKILVALLRYLSSMGLSIGGRKSIGFGKLLLDLEESKGIYIDIESLNTAEDLVKTLINIEEYAQTPIKKLIEELL